MAILNEFLRTTLQIRTDERGSSAIEFAILAPVMLLLLFGMIAYGIYFGASHSIQQIAADAARTALAGLTPAERSSLATDYVERNASGYAFIDPSELTLSVGDSSADPDQFNVRITYDAHNLPIWNLFRGIRLPGETISRRSTIRIGGL
jgi:Flp pilus assembly protein TadG